MAKTSEIIRILDNYAPPELAEDWDNSGWQVFFGNDYTTKVLICLSVTDDIVIQAEELGCNLIVSHHPVIFKPLKTIKNPVIIKAVQRGIQIYSLHTNCDKTRNGTSDLLAKKLNLKKIAALNDFVKVGIAPHEMTVRDLASYIKLACNVGRIKVVNNSGKNRIKTIAVCAGAGADFIEEIEKYNIDAYITSEVKYHNALESRRAVVFDIGHYESEKPFIEEVKNILENKRGFEVVVAKEKPAWEYV